MSDATPPKTPKNKTAPATDTRFLSIKFSLFLTLLTTFIAPLLLFLPLIIAQLLGFPLASYIGLRAENFGMTLVAFQTITLLVCLTIINRALKRRGLSWSDLGFRKFKPLRSLKYILGYFGIILVFGGILIILAIIFLNLGDTSSTPPEERVGLTVLFGNFWLAFLVGVIIAPVVEEIVFRGILFRAITKRYGLPAGVLLSSLLFTLVHINPIQMLNALPLGIYLSIMYHRLGSIYPGIILHASWNFMVLLIEISA